MHNQHSKNNSEIDENIKQEISYILTMSLNLFDFKLKKWLKIFSTNSNF